MRTSRWPTVRVVVATTRWQYWGKVEGVGIPGPRSRELVYITTPPGIPTPKGSRNQAYPRHWKEPEVRHTYPPSTHEHTDTCENITLPQLLLWAVMISLLTRRGPEQGKVKIMCPESHFVLF